RPAPFAGLIAAQLPSVQRKLPAHIAPLGGRYQFLVRVADRMERPFQFRLPEIDEPDQGRKFRRQIVVLPDIALQDMGVVGHVIEYFGRGEAVAPEHHFHFSVTAHSGYPAPENRLPPEAKSPEISLHVY